MIDFRYHLVSLISVFLALAVGIVLGAGPLQGALGSQLVEQVDTLRTERNEYRAEVDQLEHDTRLQHDFIAAAGPLLSANTLNHRNVAVVLIGDVNEIDERAITQRIRAAGGSIVETAVLDPTWFDAADEQLRSQAATGVYSQLVNPGSLLPEEATETQTLATALAVALTGRDFAGNRAPEAAGLQSRLEAANLVEFDGVQDVPADAILILTGPVAVATEGEEGTTAELTPEIPLAMSQVAQVVVAGPTATPGDLVDAVVNDRRAGDRISTVSGTETEMGQIQVPLVLAARIAGNIGHYGFDVGNQVFPPIVPNIITSPTASPLAPTEETPEDDQQAAEDEAEAAGEHPAPDAGEETLAEETEPADATPAAVNS